MTQFILSMLRHRAGTISTPTLLLIGVHPSSDVTKYNTQQHKAALIMTSSMLEKDLDQSHQRSIDVLLSSQETTNRNGKGDINNGIGGGGGGGGGVGAIEMSQLDAGRLSTKEDNVSSSLQQQQPQRQLESPVNDNNDGVQEAASEWVTSNDDKKPKVYANPISRTEICLVIAAIIGMIAVTTIGVVAGTKNHNAKDVSNIPSELEGRIQYDSVRGKWISSYVLPTRPIPSVITDQEELDFIITELTKNYPIVADQISLIPKTIEALSASSTDPYTRAAQWLTSIDTYNGKEHTLVRYALAVVYYSLQGDTWRNNTNWLSPTEYYCNWHGIICCDDTDPAETGRVSTLCNSTSFGVIIEIDLYRNNLIGPIPDIITVFTSLYSIYMSENSITGTIPGTAIATLSKFVSFYAAYNFLTGTVPVELDTNGILNTLYIQANDISGLFPNELCSCSSCKDVLTFFGTDCKKGNDTLCSPNCCKHLDNCFYTNNTVTMKQ